MFREKGLIAKRPEVGIWSFGVVKKQGFLKLGLCFFKSLFFAPGMYIPAKIFPTSCYQSLANKLQENKVGSLLLERIKNRLNYADHGFVK